MNRLFPLLVAAACGCLFLANQAATQQFDDPPAAAPATPQPPSGINAAQPAQPGQPPQPAQPGALAPPAVQPPAGQPTISIPRPGQGPSAGSFILQGGGGRGQAVIAGPGGIQARGFNQIGAGSSMIGGFGMGPGPDDPETARLMQQENELDRQSHELIQKYSEAEDPLVREKAKTALREMLIKQFDLQNQRRELELKRVEERLSKLRDQLKKRNDARAQIVDQRLEHLVNEAEGLGWGSPAGGNAGLQFGRGGISPRPVPVPR